MAQRSLESYTVTDGKAIEVSPVFAIKSCKTKHAKVVELSGFEKVCDACVIQQQMKKCKCCGANQLHKKFSLYSPKK